MTRTLSHLKSGLAATLAAALIVVSPGLGCYDALAQFVAATSAGRAITVVPAGQAGVVRTAPVALAPSAVSFTPSLPGSLAAPSVLPTAVPSVAAPAAAVSAAVRTPAARAASPVASAVAAMTPVSAQAQPGSQAAPSFKSMLAAPRTVALPAVEVAAMPAGQARSAGAAMMDAVLGIRASRSAAEPVAAGQALGRVSAAARLAANGVTEAAPGKISPALEKVLESAKRYEVSVRLVPGTPVSAEDQLVYYLSRLEGVSYRYDRGTSLISVSGITGRDIRVIAGFPAVRFISSAETVAAPASNGVSEAAPQGAASKALGFVKAVAAVAVAGGAVFGLHTAAAVFLPAVFGVTPIVAVWAVSSGLLLLPAALYARYRLAKRDSPRLKGVKLALDLTMGAFLGAVAVALPQVVTGAVLSTPMLGLAALGGLGFAAAAAAKGEGAGGIFNAIAAWGALNLLAPLFGTVAAAPLTLGAFVGLAALPALTTIAFFLGRIIAAAESGRPFAVPGSTQQIRFPSYTWVMTGVVFALLTGYSPVWTNAAFAAWMFLGQTRLFNYLFAGAAAWAIFSGLGAPVTFLVIAFAPERAAAGMEWLLGKLLPRGEPAPSTKAAPIKVSSEPSEGRWPEFHFWLKTGLAIGALLFLGAGMSATVFGFTKFATNLGIAAVFSLIPFLFAKKIIKAVMKATPMDEAQDPEVYGIMRELRERINKERAAKGQKPIPMPEMVNVPMPVPNAFATGRSPFSAMVGVTAEMKDMTLNPERTRAAMIRLMYASDPNSKQFLVFRRAIRGSISGIAENAGPQEIVRVLQTADRAQLKALGVRALRGVMGHEFNHVMHRDMLLGSIAGTIASGISFSSYGVLWAVGHAQALFARLWAKLTGKGRAPQGTTGSYRGPRATVKPEASFEPIRPQAVEPVSAAVAVQSLWGLVKIFAALWGPVLATVLSMASSRTREGHADEGGALLTEDPESLALGLGMLITWQMPAGFTLRKELLPIIASQAHVMTVNPLEQLRNAGQLPKLDAITRALVGREDDFFFNLFITHPDTMLRIERLYRMAEALAAGKKR
ncbi:MAG: M48 family metalloprotease [Elusimicrobia bacterium]|nr:M48 family metalloprotease [Elusimicrobiota bacterium]